MTTIRVAPGGENANITLRERATNTRAEITVSPEDDDPHKWFFFGSLSRLPSFEQCSHNFRYSIGAGLRFSLQQEMRTFHLQEIERLKTLRNQPAALGGTSRSPLACR